jgi:hypothetical protein
MRNNFDNKILGKMTDNNALVKITLVIKSQ